MCIPQAAMLPILIGTTVASTGLSVYSSIMQGNAQAAQQRYQAQVAQNNAVTAERQAVDAKARAATLEQAQRMKTAQTIGAQRAALAGQGADINSGNALDLQSDSAMMGEMDALTIRNNGEREAWGYRAQAQNFSNESIGLLAAAKNSKTAGFLNAGSSLLSGAGSIASANLQYSPNSTARKLPTPPSNGSALMGGW